MTALRQNCILPNPELADTISTTPKRLAQTCCGAVTNKKTATVAIFAERPTVYNAISVYYAINGRDFQ
jgi:hypothetical protein